MHCFLMNLHMYDGQFESSAGMADTATSNVNYYAEK